MHAFITDFFCLNHSFLQLSLFRSGYQRLERPKCHFVRPGISLFATYFGSRPTVLATLSILPAFFSQCPRLLFQVSTSGFPFCGLEKGTNKAEACFQGLKARVCMGEKRPRMHIPNGGLLEFLWELGLVYVQFAWGARVAKFCRGKVPKRGNKGQKNGTTRDRD